MKRAFLIVLDSCGVGALPDADSYGDCGANTLGNISEYVDGLNLPNLERFGLGNIISIKGVKAVEEKSLASWGKADEISKGKDTNTGHLEIAGLVLKTPFPTYPNGFPKDLIDKFLEVNNFKYVLGNKPASGTQIIAELGEDHIRSGQPIVYTSADSVFQIAAHESVIAPEKLWEICANTLKICTLPHNISRVIARPFIGDVGSFERTPNRRDFTLSPPEKTLLDYLKEEGQTVYGIGKIEDIFNKQGIAKAVHTESNLDGIKKTIDALKNESEGLVFVNLVDFDMKYGHRNNPNGYALALEEFDSYMPDIISGLKDDDLLIITADHGCDPTFTESTDHTREYIPILSYQKGKKAHSIGTRKTFADIAKTIADYFEIPDKIKNGESFL